MVIGCNWDGRWKKVKLVKLIDTIQELGKEFGTNWNGTEKVKVLS